jgi:hypothetical protein
MLTTLKPDKSHANYLTFLNRHKANISNNLELIRKLPDDPGISARKTIGETVRATAARGGTARPALVTTYIALGENVQFRVVDARVRERFQIAVSSVEVEEDLAAAEINLREREAVIVRGLEGLVAFHEGGIDADDLRNLIGVAQAVGIFAIAGT